MKCAKLGWNQVHALGCMFSSEVVSGREDMKMVVSKFVLLEAD